METLFKIVIKHTASHPKLRAVNRYGHPQKWLQKMIKREISFVLQISKLSNDLSCVRFKKQDYAASEKSE